MANRVNSFRGLPTNEGTMNGINTIIGSNETFLDRNAKLIPSDETTTALTNMNWIAGHHTVMTVGDLYEIPDFILSQECYGGQSVTGDDALGQLWCVGGQGPNADGKYQFDIYMLVNWKNRHNENGWSKTNIKPLVDGNGQTNASYFNINKANDLPDTYTKWISSISIYGDGTSTYTADGIHLNKSVSSKSYTDTESSTTFNVIDNIEYNPSKENPFQISYNVNTVKVLSQSHHGGSFNGDFLTSAKLSNTGTLSGTSGQFTTSYSFGNTYHGNPRSTEHILDTNHPKTTIVTNVYLGHNGELHTSYVTPRNWMHDDIVSKNDEENVWVEYHENGDLKTTYLPKASNDSAGIYTAYTYGFVGGFLQDIEDRLTGKEITYQVQSPIVKCLWKIYDSTGNTRQSLETDKTNITIERGSQVELTSVSISWNKSASFMTPNSTNGSWGNKLGESVLNNDTKYYTYDSKSFEKKQITSTYQYNLNQQLTGIQVYGVKKFVTKRDNAGDTIIVRKEAENKSANTPRTTFSVSITNPSINCWYGFINDNPFDWSDKDVTDIITRLETEMKIDGKSCFKATSNNGSKIKIADSSSFPLVNNTLDKPRYFVYIYNRYNNTPKLTKAIKGGADVITGAFAFSNQITVTIKSRTNGYPSQYTVLRSVDNNQMNLTGSFVEFQ